MSEQFPPFSKTLQLENERVLLRPLQQTDYALLLPYGLEEPELFAGVRGVRDEFTDEDLAVGVERVDDDIENLLDLGLKRMGFGLAHCSVGRSRQFRGNPARCRLPKTKLLVVYGTGMSRGGESWKFEDSSLKKLVPRRGNR